MCWHPLGSWLKGADIFVEHKLRWKLRYLDSNNNGGGRADTQTLGTCHGCSTKGQFVCWVMAPILSSVLLNRLTLLLLFGPDMFYSNKGEECLKKKQAQRACVCVFLWHLVHVGIPIGMNTRKCEYDATEGGDMEYWLGDLLWALHLNLCRAPPGWLTPPPSNSLISSLHWALNFCSCLRRHPFCSLFHSLSFILTKKREQIKQQLIYSHPFFCPVLLIFISRRHIQWQDSLISSLQCVNRQSIISSSGRK